MATVSTPVDVVMWVDPPQRTDFQVGASTRWHIAFVDPVTKAAADPDTVILNVTAPPATTTATTYPNAAITKDSTGNYHMDVALNAPGKWILNATAKSAGGVGTGNEEMVLMVWPTGQ